MTEAEESILLQCGMDTGVDQLLGNTVSLDLGKDVRETYENGMCLFCEQSAPDTRGLSRKLLSAAKVIFSQVTGPSSNLLQVFEAPV